MVPSVPEPADSEDGTRPDERGSRWRHWAIYAGLWAACLVTFWPVLSGGFLTADDRLNIVDVKEIRALGPENLRWMFFDFGPDIRYKPITYLSWAIIHAIGGLKPFLFHIANLVLHCVNACLLYRLALRMGEYTAGAASGDAARFRQLAAGAVALFWAVQPLRVETVAWLSVLSYSWTAFFLQLAMLCFLECDRERPLLRQRNYWRALVLFQFGMMSFPTAVGFSFAFLAALIFPLRLVRVDSWAGMWSAESRQALTAALPFFALTALMVGIGLYGQFVRKSYWGDPLTLEELPLWLRVLGAFYYLFYYSWRSFYPFKHYLLNEDLVGVEPSDLRLLVAVVIVMGAVAWCVLRRRTHPAGLAFAVAFIGILGPILNFTGGTPIPSDRYALLTGLLQSVAIYCLVLSLHSDKQRRLIVAGLTLFSAVVAIPSWQRTHVWKNDETYFSDQTMNLHNELYLSQAYRHLGGKLIAKNEVAAGLKHWDRAWEVSAEHSLQPIGDEYTEYLIEVERFPQAAKVLERIQQAQPGDVIMTMRLAYVWLRLGEREQAEKVVNALMTSEEYSHAPVSDYMFELPPTDELFSLMEQVSFAHLQRRETSEARIVFEMLVTASPDSSEHYSRFAKALLEASLTDEATDIIQAGLKRFPAERKLLELRKSPR